MAVTASEIFDYIDNHDTCAFERHEVSSEYFVTLRRSLRSIIVSLYECGDADARDISDRLRVILSNWLTVPVLFDENVINSIQSFGPSDNIEKRWGHDVRVFYDTALGAAEQLICQQNPIRLKLVSCIRQIRNQGQSFKIYCHRWAVSDFRSLLDPDIEEPLDEDCFLHSVKDYRESEPFDVLLKVGPLRARGWGSAPDALISAPRFSSLIQIVWSGCGDEPGFGYDPIATPILGSGTKPDGSSVPRVLRTTFSGDRNATILENNPNDADEFIVFQNLNNGRDKRRATLVQTDKDHGILYPPHSQILSFNPALLEQEPIKRRIPGESLIEGMFVIFHRLEYVDPSGFHAADGHYCKIWKARLKEVYKKDAIALVKRLHEAGLNLRNIPMAIHNWCKDTTTVIHAPQQRRHFEILINTLDIDYKIDDRRQKHRSPWWQYAWNEIRLTRGEAIHAGVQGQEIVEEQLITFLDDHLDCLRTKAANGVGFLYPITESEGLKGIISLMPVCSIEEGFMAPEHQLKHVCRLCEVEQWRV